MVQWPPLSDVRLVRHCAIPLTFIDIQLPGRTLSQLGHGVGPTRQKLLEPTIHAPLGPFRVHTSEGALGFTVHLVLEVMGPRTSFAKVVTHMEADGVGALGPNPMQLVLTVVMVRAIDLSHLVQLHSFASAGTSAITICA